MKLLHILIVFKASYSLFAMQPAVDSTDCPRSDYALDNGDGACYKMYPSDQLETYWEAARICEEDGAHLPIVKRPTTWNRMKMFLGMFSYDQ